MMVMVGFGGGDEAWGSVVVMKSDWWGLVVVKSDQWSLVLIGGVLVTTKNCSMAFQ